MRRFTYRSPRRILIMGLVTSLVSLASCDDDDGPGPDSTPPVDSGQDSSKKPDAGQADASQEDSGKADSGSTPACKAAGKQVVTFTTDDAVKLEADLYLSGSSGGPAAVLLHMVPPSNDRTNYPKAFIDALLKKGLTVLNVDRRGAGKSGGVAKDAYQGPKGKLDAKAAAAFLAAHACPVDMKRVVLVGASNGTATALDFTVYAATQGGIDTPKGLVFLTGGTYTEAQNQISGNRTLLDTIPIQFVYSTAEATWSAGFKAGKAASWRFLEYSGVTSSAGHGTRIFTAKPASVDAVATFVDQAVKK